MRDGKQLPVANLAPAADVFTTQFDEIDGTVMLVVPASRDDSPLIVVDLDDRAWTQYGEHRKVRDSNQAVHAFAKIQMPQKPDRNLSPYFREARQQAGLFQLEILSGFQLYSKLLPLRILPFLPTL